MEFLKNIHGVFTLSSDYRDFPLFKDVDGIVLGELPVKVKDLEIDQVHFEILAYNNLDSVVDQVIDKLVENSKLKITETKRVLNKIISAWENNPSNFIEKKISYKRVFKNRGLLSTEEYNDYNSVSFGKVKISYWCDITTGCGSETFYALEYYQRHLDNIDIEIEKQYKKLRQSSTRTRLKKYITSCGVTLSIPDVVRYVTVGSNHEAIGVEVETKLEKPPFPMKFSDNEINSLLTYFEGEDVVIEDTDILEIENETGVNVTRLLGWEIVTSHEGYHDTDGDFCDYSVEFTSPDNHKYFLSDSHCLVTSWNFCGDDIVPS